MNRGEFPALMELMPRIMIEGLEPREPEDVVICTPATTPSRERVTSEVCTLAMCHDNRLVQQFRIRMQGDIDGLAATDLNLLALVADR